MKLRLEDAFKLTQTNWKKKTLKFLLIIYETEEIAAIASIWREERDEQENLPLRIF